MTDTNELMRDIDRALVAIDASKPYTYKPTFSMPALSPQMQAALDAEAEMVAKVLKRAREMEAELIAARAEVERLRGQVHCRGCDGTVGMHLAPDQGGCPGRFVIDGVEMVPAAKHKETP